MNNSNTIAEMRLNVSANNKHLKDRVKSMTLIELLNNAHPSYREDYAKRLHREKLINDKEYQLYKSKTLES